MHVILYHIVLFVLEYSFCTPPFWCNTCVVSPLFAWTEMQRRTGNSASESKKQDSVVTSLKMQPRGFLFPNRIVV